MVQYIQIFMKKSSLTAVVLTKNAEKTLDACLESVSFCDEIVVIDDGSDDKTLAIAKKHDAKIYKRPLDGDFAAQRNFALEKVSHEWVLYVDADEQVDKALQREIGDAIVSDEAVAYYLRRRDFWWNHELKYGETMKVRTQGLIRLVKKGSGEWQAPVHETYICKGPTGRLNGFLNHYPHQTLKEFIHEINVYSTLRAKELYDHHTGVSMFHILVYPSAKFALTYFLKRGFLDGPAGFAYAFLMSFHSYLVRVKLYQYRRFGKP